MNREVAVENLACGIIEAFPQINNFTKICVTEKLNLTVKIRGRLDQAPTEDEFLLVNSMRGKLARLWREFTGKSPALCAGYAKVIRHTAVVLNELYFKNIHGRCGQDAAMAYAAYTPIDDTLYLYRPQFIRF